MGTRFTLNDDQRELRETYNKIGWPGTLNKSELVVYEMMSPELLTELYLSRPDAPVIKRERGFYVPLKDWEVFKSCVATGRIYKGLNSNYETTI